MLRCGTTAYNLFSDWASQGLKITVLIAEKNTLCIAGSTE